MALIFIYQLASYITHLPINKNVQTHVRTHERMKGRYISAISCEYWINWKIITHKLFEGASAANVFTLERI